VSSITIWRSSFIDSSTVGLKIYVANVDSLGRPNPQSLILDGPTVYYVLGDGNRPKPFQFVFNPPLVLPHPGKNEIAFQASPCAASFYFIYAYNNPFPDGTLWWHGQTALSLCRLRTDPTEYPIQDLVFQVDFCQPNGSGSSRDLGPHQEPLPLDRGLHDDSKLASWDIGCSCARRVAEPGLPVRVAELRENRARDRDLGLASPSTD
jgi:hypothetical protein